MEGYYLTLLNQTVSGMMDVAFGSSYNWLLYGTIGSFLLVVLVVVFLMVGMFLENKKSETKTVPRA